MGLTMGAPTPKLHTHEIFFNLMGFRKFARHTMDDPTCWISPGEDNAKSEGINLLFGQILSENCMEMKEF